jgi:competence protein ComEC
MPDRTTKRPKRWRVKLPGLPRQPFVGLALAAGAGIILADFFPVSLSAWLPIGLMFCLCALAACSWPRLTSTYALVGFGFFLLHCFQSEDTPGKRLAVRLGQRARVVTARGVVVSVPKIAPNGFASFMLKLRSMELEGNNEPSKAILLVRWRGQPEFGNELRLSGIAEPIAPPRNPGEFDLRAYLARLDVRRRLFVQYEEQGEIIHRATAYPILRAAQRARSWMENVLSRGIENEPALNGVISSVTLGVNQQTPDDIEEAFRLTGTFHLFAVSGLNVAILTQLLWTFGVLVRVPRRLIIAFLIPTIAFYCAVTGLQVSCIRAAVMASVLLGGFFVERRVFGLNSLAAAAFLILAWDTNQVFSVGFQLSFAVVLAIFLFAEPIFHLLQHWSAPDPFLPRSLFGLPRRALNTGIEWICRGGAVSLAAWTASLPFIYWNFHVITPISLLANLVVVPIAFFVLAIAMLSFLCAPLLPLLAIIFNHANWALAHLLLWAVNLFAQVPGGHFYLQRPSWPEASADLIVLDCGAGAAIHLRSRGTNWLFDCGPQRDYERQLREYLHARGVNRLDGLLLTHGDSLHIGAAPAVIDSFSPRTLIDNPLPDRSIVHRRLRTMFDQHSIKPKDVAAGDGIEISRTAQVKILFPPRFFRAARTDDQALVLQLILSSPARRVLLLSDSGQKTEKVLLEAGLDLQSDILIKGRHHSGDSGLAEFLDAVQPRLIIATSRDFPEQERINDEWAERVRTRGIKLFRQDETGAVELHFRAREWTARAYITGETFRSDNR